MNLKLLTIIKNLAWIEDLKEGKPDRCITAHSPGFSLHLPFPDDFNFQTYKVRNEKKLLKFNFELEKMEKLLTGEFMDRANKEVVDSQIEKYHELLTQISITEKQIELCEV